MKKVWQWHCSCDSRFSSRTGARLRKKQERPRLSDRGSFLADHSPAVRNRHQYRVAPWQNMAASEGAAGAGPSFQYYKDPFGRTSIYGGRAMLH
jgi:hypothetical protein